MFIVTNRLFVASEYAQEFEARFIQRSGSVDEMQGFVRNQVLRPLNEGDPYIVMTMWNSKDDFETWTKSDAFKKAHVGGLDPKTYTAPHKVEMFDVILDSA
jgi:heme oxygenase (mycobilin-producing)